MDAGGASLENNSAQLADTGLSSEAMIDVGEGKGPVLVIDNGSRTFKAGLSGDPGPFTEPNLVGRPRMPGLPSLMNRMRDTYVGQEAMQKRGILRLSYPVEKGHVTSWNDMEEVYKFICNSKCAKEESDSEAAVLLLNKPDSSEEELERTVQLFMEGLAPAVALWTQPSAALHSSGRSTGLVVDIGFSGSSIVPVHEGQAVSSAQTFPYGGQVISDTLNQLLTQRGYCFTNRAELEIVDDIKVTLCVVGRKGTRIDPAQDPNQTQYELPDGQVISLGGELHRAPEILFDPASMPFVRVQVPTPALFGIHQMVHDVIQASDGDIQQSLSDNILLTGGGSCFPGLRERFEEEVASVSSLPVSVEQGIEHAAWRGGSLLASTRALEMAWITKEQYDEVGPTIVHQRAIGVHR
eukprot:Hpha_TRINITY_DN15820_c1_g13::TRINITY_DN15820_c1_g13_i1::g.187163::m.187163/K05692/ACTB_G1; actin beta/gamma 1